MRKKFISSFEYLNSYYILAWGCRYISAHMEEASVGFHQPALFVHYVAPFDREWENGGIEVLVSSPHFQSSVGIWRNSLGLEWILKPKENPKFPSSM